MDELIAFLRARTEDDRTAALHQRAWDRRMDEERGLNVPGILVPPLSLLGSPGDPERVLVEVEAKRGIIDAAEAARDQYEHADYGHEEGIIAEAWEKAMRQIGEAYAWHPDYRAEWKPISTPAWTGNEAG